VNSPLPEVSEVKELGSNSSSEKSSQQDEDLTMDKKRSSTSSAQVGVHGCVVRGVDNLINILGFTGCRGIWEITVSTNIQLALL